VGAAVLVRLVELEHQTLVVLVVLEFLQALLALH
jgi:hypothetical protein